MPLKECIDKQRCDLCVTVDSQMQSKSEYILVVVQIYIFPLSYSEHGLVVKESGAMRPSTHISMGTDTVQGHHNTLT